MILVSNTNTPPCNELYISIYIYIYMCIMGLQHCYQDNKATAIKRMAPHTNRVCSYPSGAGFQDFGGWASRYRLGGLGYIGFGV